MSMEVVSLVLTTIMGAFRELIGMGMSEKDAAAEIVRRIQRIEPHHKEEIDAKYAQKVAEQAAQEKHEAESASRDGEG